MDSGKFDWSNEKFPELNQPDPAYHGINYWEIFKEAAYITKARCAAYERSRTSPFPF